MNIIEARALFAEYRETITDMGLDANGDFSKDLLRQRLQEQRKCADILLPEFEQFPAQTIALFHGVLKFTDMVPDAVNDSLSPHELPEYALITADGLTLLSVARQCLDDDTMGRLLYRTFLMQRLWAAAETTEADVGGAPVTDGEFDEKDWDGTFDDNKEKQWAQENGFDPLSRGND